ncbi:alpha/beta fold hydrolase [Piscirickettsia litoralis]|uniref:Alpha/beta hydrolase n=1 Tax=Piscirickettsia litoralis TaxID=1891921 RepID=A0ABX3A226_9GAMM|nr:alpha/beta fold hydrolase [Piscirickettsia litoralis]ODN42883.1 alpha/beta hydrolase [Piscirickettsia litoralis]
MLELSELEQEVKHYERSLNKFISSANNLDSQENHVTTTGDGDSIAIELIAENALWRLQRYCSKITGRPLLVTYALLNNPSILDLSKDHSFIAGLIAAGFDVYLLSWKNDQSVGNVQSYCEYIIDQGLSQAVEKVLAHCHKQQLELLGVCQGGVFSLCLSVLKPEKIKRLILMGTPIDFQTTDNQLSKLVKQLYAIKPQLNCMKVGNLINSRAINSVLSYQKPANLLMLKYANFIQLERQQRQEFYQLEKWLWDSGWLSVAALYEFIDDFYIHNNLIEGFLTIAGQSINLAELTVPVLNLYAENDWLVPPSASCALKEKVNPELLYQEVGFETGHIGLYVSRRTQKQVINTIAGT